MRSRTRYGVPPQRYPELAAIVGETSDNLPGVPGVGQGYAAKWINEYDGLDNVIAHADKITGKKGESLREHLGDVIRNRQLNALVCDLDLAVEPTTSRRSRGTASRCTSSSTPGVPRAARPPVRDVTSAGGDRRHRLRAGRRSALGPRRGRRLARRHALERRVRSACRSQGTLAARAPVRSTRSRWPPRRRRRLGRRGRRSRPRTTPRSPTWFADPRPAQGLHDAKGPMLALAARGWSLRGLASDTALSAYLARPDQRSYDLADLTLRYLKRELKVGARRRRAAHASTRVEDAARRAETAMLARPGRSRPGRRTRRRARGARRHAACSPTSSCRSSTCSR